MIKVGAFVVRQAGAASWTPQTGKGVKKRPGRGHACLCAVMDNVFIERLWRSVKHEEIYLNGCEDIPSQREALERWFARYNDWRPHQALGNQTPACIHEKSGKKRETSSRCAVTHLQ